MDFSMAGILLNLIKAPIYLVKRVFQTTKQVSISALDLSSDFLGDKSPQAKTLSIIFQNMLNLIQAVVCVGYIAGLFHFLFPMFAYSYACGVSLLVCAGGYELLDSINQTDKANTTESISILKKYPFAARVLGLFSSLFGSMQYFVRNYRLSENFSKTNAAHELFQVFSRCLRMSHHAITGARFALFGGLVGFSAHLLVSFMNWDKLIEVSSATPRAEQTYPMLAQSLWYGVLFCALAAVMPSWLVTVPIFAALFLTMRMTSSVTASDDSDSSLKKEPQGKGVVGRGFEKISSFMRGVKSRFKSLWKASAIITLPAGSFLYALVDFFNSYAIRSDMGWTGNASLAACAAFGLFSWYNVMLLWGFITVRFIYNDQANQEEMESNYVIDNYPWFVRFFYMPPAVRRLSSCVKEVVLCVIDFFNNKLTIGLINSILRPLLGVSLPLFVLNLFTVFYGLNQVVIRYFQGTEELKPCIGRTPQDDSLINAASIKVLNMPSYLQASYDKHINGNSQSSGIKAA